MMYRELKWLPVHYNLLLLFFLTMGPGMMKNWWLDLVITNTFSSLYDSVKTDRFYKMNVDTALPKNRRLAEIFVCLPQSWYTIISTCFAGDDLFWQQLTSKVRSLFKSALEAEHLSSLHSSLELSYVIFSRPFFYPFFSLNFKTKTK